LGAKKIKKYPTGPVMYSRKTSKTFGRKRMIDW
jgi:hypothetical protein